MTDVLAMVLRGCRRHRDAPALTGPRGATLSYRELGHRVLSTRDNLRAAGLAGGDRMLFSIRPGPAGVVLALGVVAAGGTVVFADPGAGPELFTARFELAGPRWAAAESLLYAASGPRPLRALALRRGLLLPDYRALPVRHVYSGPWLPGVPRRAIPARRLASGSTIGIEIPAAAPEQEGLVVFTSGSTAAPKAVVHTRGSLGAGLEVLAARCALRPGDVLYTDQLMLGLPALVAGAHWTMPPFGFSASAEPAVVAKRLTRATHSFAVPADLARMLDAIERGVAERPGLLRCLLVGAAPVTKPLLRRATAALPGTEVLVVYGMTEIVPVAITTAGEKLAHQGGDLAGAPLPGVRARIADDGELLLSGRNLCRGYLGEPSLTEHATGDLATMDDGRIVLAGRKKDMIIRGKVNVYPGLYEPTVCGLPGVREAVMVGIPDELGDERIVLAVVPEDTMRNRPGVLPGHPLAGSVRAALPTLIDAGALPDEVVAVSRIPTAGRTSKPDRPALRALLAEAGTA